MEHNDSIRTSVNYSPTVDNLGENGPKDLRRLGETPSDKAMETALDLKEIDWKLMPTVADLHSVENGSVQNAESCLKSVLVKNDISVCPEYISQVDMKTIGQELELVARYFYLNRSTVQQKIQNAIAMALMQECKPEQNNASVHKRISASLSDLKKLQHKIVRCNDDVNDSSKNTDKKRINDCYVLNAGEVGYDWLYPVGPCPLMSIGPLTGTAVSRSSSSMEERQGESKNVDEEKQKVETSSVAPDQRYICLVETVRNYSQYTSWKKHLKTFTRNVKSLHCPCLHTDLVEIRDSLSDLRRACPNKSVINLAVGPFSKSEGITDIASLLLRDKLNWVLSTEIEETSNCCAVHPLLAAFCQRADEIGGVCEKCEGSRKILGDKACKKRSCARDDSVVAKKMAQVKKMKDNLLERRKHKLLEHAALMGIKDFISAEQYVLEVLQQNPNDGHAHGLVASVYLAWGYPEKSFEYYYKAVLCDPKDPYYYGLACDMAMDVREYEKAWKLCREGEKHVKGLPELDTCWVNTTKRKLRTIGYLPPEISTNKVKGALKEEDQRNAGSANGEPEVPLESQQPSFANHVAVPVPASRTSFISDELNTLCKIALESLHAQMPAMAVDKYERVIHILESTSAEVREGFTGDINCVKYGLAVALRMSGSYNNFIRALQIYQEELHRTDFPQRTLTWAIAAVYYDLFRFEKAMECLRSIEWPTDESISEQELSVCFWPGCNQAIPETEVNFLKFMISELEEKCAATPDADAICSHTNCLSLQAHVVPSRYIFKSDPDFRGCVEVSCAAKCHFTYHAVCWKAFKESRSDKSFVGQPCWTPDCFGDISKICIIDSEGLEKTRLVTEVKSLTQQAVKTKKLKSEKKAEQRDVVKDVNKAKRKEKNLKKERSFEQPVVQPKNFDQEAECGNAFPADVQMGIVTAPKKNKKAKVPQLPTLSLMDPASYPTRISAGRNASFLTGATGGRASSFSDFEETDESEAIPTDPALRDLSSSFGAFDTDDYADDDRFQEMLSSFSLQDETSSQDVKISETPGHMEEGLYNFLLDYLNENGPVTIESDGLWNFISLLPEEVQSFLKDADELKSFLLVNPNFVMVDNVVASACDLKQAFKLALSLGKNHQTGKMEQASNTENSGNLYASDQQNHAKGTSPLNVNESPMRKLTAAAKKADSYEDGNSSYDSATSDVETELQSISESLVDAESLVTNILLHEEERETTCDAIVSAFDPVQKTTASRSHPTTGLENFDGKGTDAPLDPIPSIKVSPRRQTFGEHESELAGCSPTVQVLERCPSNIQTPKSEETTCLHSQASMSARLTERSFPTLNSAAAEFSPYSAEKVSSATSRLDQQPKSALKPTTQFYDTMDPQQMSKIPFHSQRGPPPFMYPSSMQSPVFAASSTGSLLPVPYHGSPLYFNVNQHYGALPKHVFHAPPAAFSVTHAQHKLEASIVGLRQEVEYLRRRVDELASEKNELAKQKEISDMLNERSHLELKEQMKKLVASHEWDKNGWAKEKAALEKRIIEAEEENNVLTLKLNELTAVNNDIEERYKNTREVQRTYEVMFTKEVHEKLTSQAELTACKELLYRSEKAKSDLLLLLRQTTLAGLTGQNAAAQSWTSTPGHAMSLLQSQLNGSPLPNFSALYQDQSTLNMPKSTAVASSLPATSVTSVSSGQLSSQSSSSISKTASTSSQVFQQGFSSMLLLLQRHFADYKKEDLQTALQKVLAANGNKFRNLTKEVIFAKVQGLLSKPCTETSPAEECVICFHAMGSDSTGLSCGHNFHARCIHEWFRSNTSCPICRRLEVPENEFPSLS